MNLDIYSQFSWKIDFYLVHINSGILRRVAEIGADLLALKLQV